MTVPDRASLRQGLLAAVVLHDVDLDPSDDGAWLPTAPPTLIPWGQWAGALDGADPTTPLGYGRLARYARARVVLDAAAGPPLRPLGLPAGHPEHPGPGWVRVTIPGGVLDVGLGVAGLVADQPDRISPLPVGLPTGSNEPGSAGPGSADRAFAAALVYLEQMATLAVARQARRPHEPLRPMGDCDVVTLLASRTFRAALVRGGAGPPTGLRTAAAPMRRRGWLDVSRIDPAFVGCAAAATDPDQRGFARPLLVAADEVRLAGARAGYSRR